MKKLDEQKLNVQKKLKNKKNLNQKKEAEIPKTVKLVSSLCEILKNTGCVVNMDNLYSSPEVFIKLLGMGIYTRGTVRTN